MKLIRPTKKYEAAWKKAVAEFRNDPKSIKLWGVLGDPNDIAGIVRSARLHSQGKNLPKDWVPYDLLWLVDGDEIIGIASIRHSLNDFLASEGGHIGYEIVPSRRGMGYGKVILELALIKMKELGLRKILVTSLENNIASWKIIENCGGRLENRVDTSEGLTRRYWFDLFAPKM